jgi:hypothetical protein
MKKQIIKQIFFWCILISLNASCTSITKLFPKQPRPFQAKEFNSEQWKNGDYQTRGEMTNGKLFEQIRVFKTNQTEQIIQLLGKPDQITKAHCCYAGRAGKSGEVDLWLYYIETEDFEKDKQANLKKKALKIYFGDIGINVNTGEITGNHDYFPAIGYFKRIVNERLKI